LNWVSCLSPIVAVCIAFALTPWVLRHAKRVGMMALPTARSSHVRPTPQGGGIGIVVGFLLVVAIQTANRGQVDGVHIALLGGGALVALTGWFDDRKGLGSYVRLLLYGLAAAWAVGWLGGFPSFQLGSVEVRLGGAGFLLSWVFIVFLTNIYNFMDGIDGIAGVEAMTTGLIGGGLVLMSGDSQLAVLAFSLGAASLGFLFWNWPPAKIFMGDVGSNFLGYSIAVLAISSEGRGSLPASIWILLLGVFVADGVATFVRRLIRRKPPQVAHKTHGYQGAVRKGYSHAEVTTVVLGINVGLGALAFVGLRTPSLLPFLAGGAYLFLLILHWWFSPLRHRCAGV